MHSRPMGGGRRLALLGALVVIVATFLPWHTLGGGAAELPAQVISGWPHVQGIAVLLSGLATLGLIVLPYAVAPRPVATDRGLAFAIPAVTSIVAILAWVWEVRPALQGLLPASAFGFWVAAIGTVMLARAAFEISREPPRR